MPCLPAFHPAKSVPSLRMSHLHRRSRLFLYSRSFLLLSDDIQKSCSKCSSKKVKDRFPVSAFHIFHDEQCVFVVMPLLPLLISKPECLLFAIASEHYRGICPSSPIRKIICTFHRTPFFANCCLIPALQPLQAETPI